MRSQRGPLYATLLGLVLGVLVWGSGEEPSPLGQSVRAGTRAASPAATPSPAAPVLTAETPPESPRPVLQRRRGPAGRDEMVEQIQDLPDTPYLPAERVVALTFDDGPGAATEAVLRILERERAPATFFMIGAEARARSGLAEKVGARHQVGGHTEDHLDLRLLGAPARSSQLRGGAQSTQRASGRRVRCTRPPFGSYDASVRRAIQAAGTTPVLWSVDPRDWQRPPSEMIVQRVLAALHPGAIVLLHDGGGARERTVEALPRIISGIRAKGYEIVSLPGC